MKNVFKWRIVTNKYLYITDENNGDPFILDKITGNRIYPNGIVTGTTVDDGKIGQIVSNIKVENTYKDLFDAMVRLAYTDSDASKLTFLDYKNYWNLDSDECVIEAVTPKCEGYEPVFNISAHTISDGEVEYTFYAERNEYDKTLRYNLDLGIPKGEKGDKGKDGKGCKGDQGDPGQNAIIQVINATAHPIPSGSAPTATVVTATTQSDNTYTMSFDFGIPKGESGGTGGPGEKGDDGYSGVITDVVPHTNTVGHNDPANVTVSNIQIVRNDVNSRYETSFDLNFDIPKGETGAMGPEGLPAIFRQCDARVVETLDWYETAQVEAILTPLGFENKYDLTFEFKIPKGKPGENSIVESGGTAGGGWIYNFNVPEFRAVTGLREPIGDFDVQYHQASGDADVTLRIYYPEDWGGTTPGGRGRSIEVNDSEILSSSSSTPLNLTDGTGVTISGDTGGTVTISHEDTSNQPSVINTGSNYIQSVELDGMGHVVGLTSSTISETYRPIEVNDVQILDKNETSKTLNLVNGTGISISGATDGTVTINSTVVNTDTTYKLTLNGTQKGSGTTDLGTFYAPTSGGTSGQYLKSNGNGAPIWDTFPTIPSAPGTLTTTATTSQTAVTDESLSGTINLHKISKTGNYNDLLNKPTIPAAQVNADWNASSGVTEILNKPTFATVATSGSYNDLSNKPTIPVNTDYQVQQSPLTTNAEYCLLAKSISGTGNTTVTSTTIYDSSVTINPSTHTITGIDEIKKTNYRIKSGDKNNQFNTYDNMALPHQSWNSDVLVLETKENSDIEPESAGIIISESEGVQVFAPGDGYGEYIFSVYDEDDLTSNNPIPIFGVTNGAEIKCNGDLHVTGDAYMENNLTVSGSTLLNSGLTVSGDSADITAGLNITGDTHMTDGLEVDGLTQLNSGLEVSGGSADLTAGLNITGNTYCTGVYYASGTYSSSDIRKKDVLGEISLDKAYELVNKCQTIFYNWKDDETNKKEIGLIAQEVQQYFPELVSEDKDGYLTLDYSKLSVILLTVIKDLTQKVNKIDKLEEKIKMLEEKLK